MSVDSIQVLDIIRNPLFFNVSLWKDLDFWLCCIGKYALAGKLSNVFILLLCRRAVRQKCSAGALWAAFFQRLECPSLRSEQSFWIQSPSRSVSFEFYYSVAS